MRVPRTVAGPANVAVWIAVVLVADAGAGIWFQRLLGAGTWALLIALLAGESRSARYQVGAVVIAATALEYAASPLLGLYTYRLENVPAFVPPGHGLVYLAALTIGMAVAGGSWERRLTTSALLLGGAWAVWGVTVAGRPDTGGFALYLILAAFILRGRAPAVYAAAFLVTGYLEIVGTGIGTWAWAREDFMGATTLGNPPSGIAGGYCFLDLVGITVAAALAGRGPARPTPVPALRPLPADA
jgi:hypothetical protein